MSVLNRRNALVGYVTLRAASRYLGPRRRRRQSGSRSKIVAFVVLGLVSLGLVAVLAAVFMKRRRKMTEQAEDVVEQVGGDVAAEADAALTEPIPAT